jgi:hypothetical protein
MVIAKVASNQFASTIHYVTLLFMRYKDRATKRVTAMGAPKQITIHKTWSSSPVLWQCY